MSAKFEYTELLEKGIELESCGMGDIARDIYKTFVRGNASCPVGTEIVDILMLLYGENVYERVNTSALAVDYAYMALMGKRFLLNLHATHGNTWQFTNGHASGYHANEAINNFFEWLRRKPRNFNLGQDSARIILADKELKKTRDVSVEVAADVLGERSFIRRMCRIARVDLQSM